MLPNADACPYPELGTAVPAALGGPYDPQLPRSDGLGCELCPGCPMPTAAFRESVACCVNCNKDCCCDPGPIEDCVVGL